MKDLSKKVKEFFDLNPEVQNEGRILNIDEYNNLPRKIRKRIPKWYKELLTTFPIAGMEIGIPNNFGQEVLIAKPIEKLPLLEISFNDFQEIEENSLELFPGYEMIKKDFFCFARDEFSSGDGIFINGKEENPQTLLVSHDMDDSVKELIKNATILTVNFTDIFTLGKISNNKRELTEKEIEAISPIVLKNIESIYSFIDNSIDSNNKELYNNIKISIEQSRKFLEEGNLIRAILSITNTLDENEEIRISKELFQKTEEAFKYCKLHIGDLCYIEDRIEDK